MFDNFDWSKLFTEEDKTKNKDVIRQIKVVGDAARKCLASGDFAIYKEKYEEVEKKVLGLLINKARNFNGDISKFGAETLAIIVRIDALRALLKDVETDSRKGIDAENID